MLASVAFPRIPPAMRVVLLIRSLNRGGAERQLVNLAVGLHKVGISVTVAVFYAGGPLQRELEHAGVRVLDLRKSGRWDAIGFTSRLASFLRQERADVLYGFVVTPNILGTLLRPFVPGLKVVWGIRLSQVDLDRYDWLVRVNYSVERVLARFADAIIANSEAGRRICERNGYPARRLTVVPNGIDTERFKRDSAGGAAIREQWGWQQQTVIGLVGRVDPVKAHDLFFEAAARLAQRVPRARFLCVGVTAAQAKAFEQPLRRLGLENLVRFSPPTDDLARAYSALDILCMCSHGEGFPNVVAEAMSCGVPCVVTDVGDAAYLVGETGIVVPPRDPERLAAGLEAMIARISAHSEQMRCAARQRIADNFGLESMTQKTIAVFEQVLANGFTLNSAGTCGRLTHEER